MAKQKVEIMMGSDNFEVFEKFRAQAKGNGEEVGDAVAEALRPHLTEADGRNFVIGADLIAAVEERVGLVLHRFWLEYMRRERWVEGIHWFRKSRKRIFYDLEKVWGDCKYFPEYPEKVKVVEALVPVPVVEDEFQVIPEVDIPLMDIPVIDEGFRGLGWTDDE